MIDIRWSGKANNSARDRNGISIYIRRLRRITEDNIFSTLTRISGEAIRIKKDKGKNPYRKIENLCPHLKPPYFLRTAITLPMAQIAA